MAFPKITYNDGAAQTLPFYLPPIGKPFAWRDAVRHDSVSSGGVKQTAVERVDEFLEINMAFVEPTDDIAAWHAFMTWAILGGEFEYFPDADVDVSDTYTLEDTTWKAERAAARQWYKFKLKFRKAVAG